MLLRCTTPLLLWTFLAWTTSADDNIADSKSLHSQSFLNNGVTAHRGNSSAYPENTLPAFQSGIALGADWIELDVFQTRDGQIVVTHDSNTERVGDISLDVANSTYQELSQVDVATDFRKRTGKTKETCPPEAMPLLKDVLNLVMKQNRTRVSIQPKMNCVADTVALVKQMKAEAWVGFNDGNLQYMIDVKRLAPNVRVFWDRGPNTNIDADIRTAKKHGFESLVLHHSGVTSTKIREIHAAGLEAGAWTVNDRESMEKLLGLGIDRIYTDQPGLLLKIHRLRDLDTVDCEGDYPGHLQGICTDEEFIYWSFTTTLVKTDLQGKIQRKIPVANHHGDLCHRDGKLFVAVNLGKFNDPQGNADSWVYVYDAKSLDELARHEVQEVFHGAGGIGYHNGHFFVVGGLPDDFEENYVYEYDGDFRVLTRHVIQSGHTHLGIQTATFAHDRWWFGCYGSPSILLVTDADFQLKSRVAANCSLGIESFPQGRLLVASGNCTKSKGCIGSIHIAYPNPEGGFKLKVTDKVQKTK